MRWRRGTIAGAVIGALLVAAPAGWWFSDRLEEDNDFCNACHLTAEVPLHVDIRRDFDSLPAMSLAAFHAAAGPEVPIHAESRSFRCVDCHGGTGLAGRARVKLLAAKDAFWYAVGQFEEPTHMRWPLLDADCRKCHEDFEEREPEAWENPRFHQLSVHNHALGVACVDCHQAHEQGGGHDSHFLVASHLRSQCARCHPEFEEAQ